MRTGWNKFLLVQLLFLIFGVFLLSVLSCEPGFELKVENNTDKVLTIYVDVSAMGKPARQGNIEPGEHIYTRGLWLVEEPYEIIAKNKHGDIVYSREFGYFELRDDYDFKVVISELDIDLEKEKYLNSSDNVTVADNITGE